MIFEMDAGDVIFDDPRHQHLAADPAKRPTGM
jgi:hypothetical protein